MWEVRDNLLSDQDRQFPLNNDYANLSLYMLKQNKFDTPRTVYRIQEDPLEYENYSTICFRSELVPSALTIHCKGNCSAIVKIYGGMEILTEKPEIQVIKKWWLIYNKKNGDVSNNSTLTLVNPDINCERTIGRLRIHFDDRNITNLWNLILKPVINVYGVRTNQLLQTVHKNKRLKLSSESEKFAIESGNEEKFDYFSSLPNETITKIFGYLDLKSLARTAQVCSRFNHIVTKTNKFYYNLDFKPYWNVFSPDVFDRFMKKTKHLKKLSLSWCNRDLDGDYYLKLKKFLNGAKNTLTHLYIDGQGLTYCVNKSLIKAIFACKELLELHLRSTACCFEWFSAGGIQFKNLRKLDLAYASIEDKTLITILSMTRKLKHLIIDSYTGGTCMDWTLDNLVAFNINLETFSLCDNSFTNRGLKLFEFHTNLVELDLSYCHLYTLFPQTFTFNFLAKCSRLKRLGLAGWKDLKDEHLVTVNEHCEKLEQVNISNLKLITANSIKELLKLKNLKVLNVANCTHETISLSQIKEWQNEFPHVQIWSHLE